MYSVSLWLWLLDDLDKTAVVVLNSLEVEVGTGDELVSVLEDEKPVDELVERNMEVEVLVVDGAGVEEAELEVGEELYVVEELVAGELDDK
jgi:hypothetical protein